MSNPKRIIDLTSSSKDAKITSMPTQTFGRCYSIHLENNIVAQGVQRIDFHSNMDFYTYFHHPGQFYNINSKSYALKGRKHFMDMTYSITKNTLQSQSRIPCSIETSFNFDSCFYAAIADDLMAKFNCVVPFISSVSWVMEFIPSGN